jgi:hypothetical protein
MFVYLAACFVSRNTEWVLRKIGVCHVENIIVQTSKGNNRLTFCDKVFHIIFFSNFEGEGVPIVCKYLLKQKSLVRLQENSCQLARGEYVL